MKVVFSYISPTSLRVWLNLGSILITTVFILVSAISIISGNRDYFWGIIVIIPVLVRLVVTPRVIGSTENSSSEEEHETPYMFINIQPIRFVERAFVSLISDSFLSTRFLYSSFFVIALWFLYARSNLLLLFQGLLLLLLVQTLLSLYQHIAVVLSIRYAKIPRVVAAIMNLALNVLSVILFFSLFSFLGIPPADALLIRILEPLSIINEIDTALTFGVIVILIVGSIFADFFWRMYAARKIYFHDTGAGKKKRAAKRKAIHWGGGLLGGAIARDIAWLSKFPGLFVTILYPLIFLVFASKLLFVTVEGFPVESLKTLYLVTSVGYLSFFSDNQLALNASYFAFDLNHPVRVRSQFISKAVITGFFLILIGILLYILNNVLSLGFELDQRVLLAFLFYFFLVQAKGIIISIYGYKPLIYATNHLRYSQFSFTTSCMLTVSNIIILAPLYLLVLLPFPPLATAVAAVGALLVYLLVVLISERLFQARYFRIVERTQIVEK
jgi:hypothetical protein